MTSSLSRQRGQATVEFAIMAAALIPFILVIALMARIADVQHSTAQASQYAVWDKTASPGKNANRVTNEVRARFFTRAPKPLADQERVADNSNEYRAYWVDQSNRRVLRRFSDVQDTAAQSSLNSAQTVFDFGAPLIVAGLGVNRNGMWNSTVRTPLAQQSRPLFGPFATEIFSPQASAALMADGWTAFNGAAVRRSLDDARVTTNDVGLTLSVRVLATLFRQIQLEADPSSFSNRNVDPDVIPCEFRINRRGRNTC